MKSSIFGLSNRASSAGQRATKRDGTESGDAL